MFNRRSSSSRSAVHHWVVLGVFSVLSIVGNALHAFESGAGSLDPRLSAAIATIAPITLLASTHSLVLHRRDFTGWTRGAAMAITFLIASASFVLSFSALWELATMAGIPSDRSWLMAVIIDAMVIQSTMSLVLAAASGVRSSTSPDSGSLTAPSDRATTDLRHSRSSDLAEPNGVVVDAYRPPVTSKNAVWPPIGESGELPVPTDKMAASVEAADLDEDLMMLASGVRESSKAVMSREAIAQALQLRLDGHSLREIARAVGVRSHSTIGDWIRAAAKTDARFDSSSTVEERNDETYASQPHAGAVAG